jgi:nitrogen-specific signal transduction histidine kinase
MPDDQNDKLMEQFIQRATPKLLEAMQEGLAKQIEDQIGGLKANAEKMLDEIKDARRERETREKQQAEEMGQLKTLLERGEAPKDIHRNLSPEPIRLTRTQARDAALYRKAKAQAEKAGTTLEIVTDE